MTLGTPVVCTGVCGNPELVAEGENGLLVPRRNPEALAEAMRKLLADKSLRDMFARVGELRATRFSRGGTFPEVERVLEEAAGAGRSRLAPGDPGPGTTPSRYT